MGTLLLPSLTNASFFRITPVDRKEALTFMRSFREQAINVPESVDRVAQHGCHMSEAPISEQGLGHDFQLLENFPLDALDGFLDLDRIDGIDDPAAIESIEEMARSHFTGVRGRRALFIETEDDEHITLILGTLVTYNERRYTREFWDAGISTMVQNRLVIERAADLAMHAHDPLGGFNFEQNLGHNPLQALEVAEVSRELRRLGKGNLLSVPKDPVLLALADRLDAVVVHLGGVPKPEQPAGGTPPLDVDKLIEQSRVIAQDAAAQVSKNVNKARNWLADRLSDLDKR